MSAREEPPRKKQKSVSGGSRSLRSRIDSPNSENCRKTKSTPPATPSKDKLDTQSKTNMTDSRRRSARKTRNNELRDNEQSVAVLAQTKSTPSKNQPNRKSADSPMNDDDSMEEDGATQSDLDDAEIAEEEKELAWTDAARSSATHQSRPGAFSLSAMASLLSSQSGQLKSLLASLREPDPSVQLIALNELASMLSMSTEESLAGYIQTDAFVVELVSIMRGPNAFGEENPDMMLLACRCLANLMEALPSATANVAYGGAIPVLCQKLLEIQFIDLAEQALSTLEKISKDYPSSIVREGGMAACLTYLDFFSTNVQRIAVNTAANCARNIPHDCFAIVRDVVPTLQNVILGTDAKVVEAGCLSLTRLVESFRNSPDKLEQLLNADVLATIMKILLPEANSGTNVPEYIKTRFLHILGLGAKVSGNIALQLIKQDLTRVLYQLLTGLSTPISSIELKQNSVSVLQALIHLSRDQVTEILNLISAVLPGLPEGGNFAELSSKELGNDDSRSSAFGSSCPAEYEQFVTVILPTLIDIYNSTVDTSLRKTTLVALQKICHNLDKTVLRRVVSDVPLAVFITSVLGAQNLELVLSGARIATILLERLADVYAEKLLSEGSVAELEILESKFGNLASRELPKVASDGHKTNDRNQSATQSTSHTQLDRDIRGMLSERRNEEDEYAGDEDDEEEFPYHGTEDDEDDDEDDEDDVENDEDNEEDDEDDNEEADVEDDSELANRTTSRHKSKFTGTATDASLLKPLLDYSRISEATSSKNDSDEIISILIGRQAVQFKIVYEEVAGDRTSQTQTIQQLKMIADGLCASNAAKEAYTEFARILCGDTQVSSYNLKSSGVLSALLQSLGDSGNQQNRRLFLELCMTNSCFSVLVLKLQELLSRTENFAVSSTSITEEKRSANILAKQLRLKLVADDTSDIPRPYRNLMVSIHAIATLKALDDYLRPRLMSASSSTHSTQRLNPTSTPTSASASSSGLLGRAPDALQGALAQLAAAGTALPESIRDRLASLGVDPASFQSVSGSSQADDGSMHSDKDDSDKEADITGTVSLEMAPELAARTPSKAKSPHSPALSSTATPPPISASKRPSKMTTHANSERTGATSRSPMSYAAALSTAPKDWHIQFEVNGAVVPYETTIYGAIHGSSAIGDASIHGRPSSSVYQINFKKVHGPAPIASAVLADMPDFGQMPKSIEQETEAAPILRLLDVLYSMNSDWGDLMLDKTNIVVQSLSSSSFVNTKLTAKLNRQLDEPLIVASQCLPIWSQELPRYYPFLFPFETRYLFLQSTSFGYSRSMTRWQAAAKKDRADSRSFLGRLQRQKVRISRPRMLESAMKVMELYGSSPSILEVEYFDEVGTGLGPTLEFYSTVSKEISKKKLNLWRDYSSSSQSDYAFSQNGLFPRPLPAFENEQNLESTKKSLLLFKTIGTFVARSMIDSRLIDVPFNSTFFRSLNNANSLPATIGAVYGVDKDLAKSLSLVNKFASAYQSLVAELGHADSDINSRAANIMFDGVRVDDLGLDFTYPGNPELELIVNGAQTDVTIFNVATYLEKVVDFTIGSGILRQLQAFEEGFSQVFPYTALRAFTAQELTMFFGRSEEDWSAATLLDSIKADHGYTMDSVTIRNLVLVLSELNETDRREFLQFMTGSPKLPIGGFKSLTPQFTVVCKPHEAPMTADDYLPSVMTCVNYLKMPDYSKIEVLRAKLFTAMREGGGSFHLS